ncbi:hypothetical protein ACC718_36935, partial [Rhizobium ruizarguesonis]
PIGISAIRRTRCITVSSDGRFCGLLKSLRQNPFVRARKVYEQFSKEAGSLAQIGKDPAKTEQVTKVVYKVIILHCSKRMPALRSERWR